MKVEIQKMKDDLQKAAEKDATIATLTAESCRPEETAGRSEGPDDQSAREKSTGKEIGM